MICLCVTLDLEESGRFPQILIYSYHIITESLPSIPLIPLYLVFKNSQLFLRLRERQLRHKEQYTKKYKCLGLNAKDCLKLDSRVSEGQCQEPGWKGKWELDDEEA